MLLNIPDHIGYKPDGNFYDELQLAGPDDVTGCAGAGHRPTYVNNLACL